MSIVDIAVRKIASHNNYVAITSVVNKKNNVFFQVVFFLIKKITFFFQTLL